MRTWAHAGETSELIDCLSGLMRVLKWCKMVTALGTDNEKAKVAIGRWSVVPPPPPEKEIDLEIFF